MKSFFNAAADVFANISAAGSALGVATWGVGLVGEITCQVIEAPTSLPYFMAAAAIGAAAFVVTLPGIIYWDAKRSLG